MDSLESLLAERDIRNLIALYPQYADDGNTEALGQLFAESGSLTVMGERFVGPAAIGEWVRATLQNGTMRHLMMNAQIVVESSGTASGSMDMLLLAKSETGWQPAAAPRYTDHFVNTAQGWKFASREIDVRM